ncbi:hypothetical protein BV898_00598 [Hypsibius exemplaris]|uniref:F-box domain-containing protein n=1 Tax=Hypsibius exemplaris TaxID=2072580 RepID=A0A1W0XDW4_HYPEX|nr:hypothetical protein BV898_00598 [Hypsibius exemplaris]
MDAMEMSLTKRLKRSGEWQSQEWEGTGLDSATALTEEKDEPASFAFVQQTTADDDEQTNDEQAKSHEVIVWGCWTCIEVENKEKAPVVPEDITWVPREDVKDVFRYCDLPTRCKLRQVSKYWKHLVSLEEVNEVVMVDDSCHVLWPSLRGCIYAETCADRNLRATNLQDYRRQGLMGGHVRVIIYRGDNYGHDNARESWEAAARRFHIIGMHCPNVRSIVMWRWSYTGGCHGREWANRALWAEGKPLTKKSIVAPPGFPLIESVILLESGIAFRVHHRLLPNEFSPDDRHLQFYLRIPLLEIDWSSGTEACEVSLDQFVWPYGDSQRCWVARYAPLLPEKLRKFIASTSTVKILRLLEFECNGTSGRLELGRFLADLSTADYQSMPASLLRILAVIISAHRNLDSFADPPPYPFTDNWHFGW